MRTRRCIGLATAAAVLAGMLMVVTANPAHAALDPTQVTTAKGLQEEAQQFVDAAIKLESSIVRAEDGTLSVRTTAAQAGVSHRAFKQVVASLQVVNRGVLGGELETTPNLQVRPAGFTTMHNGVIYRWWGQEIHFSSTTTSRIIGAMNAGAGVATLVAIITAALGGSGLAVGVAAALLAIGAGVLQVCANSNGVRIMKPYVGPPWCAGH